MAKLLNAIFDSWEGLKDANVVNTFGDIPHLVWRTHHWLHDAPGHPRRPRYSHGLVAISTGWDWLRAEVLVSLRAAQEYTYIAQLIGRMVRTPLARTITVSDCGTLNDVFVTSLDSIAPR
jgi:type III restriction enzyme